ncbi:MAG: hypothetical protein QOE54_966 [Streptosporangiaceae bacterium]|jgi:hypothetical protein|nr:hypothetical protein [Streptosporangiaceae bacterium]MDX6428600.1 hypothetical protein [Streptosporangiaceae bacterium]
MDSPRERWIDEAAGPIVRPYAMTRGRTRPSGERLDLVTLLVATGRTTSEHVRLSPEQQRLLELCQRQNTVADLASELDLALGVVRVLLGDLHSQGLIEVRQAATPAEQPDRLLLRKVLNDLRAL